MASWATFKICALAAGAEAAAHVFRVELALRLTCIIRETTPSQLMRAIMTCLKYDIHAKKLAFEPMVRCTPGRNGSPRELSIAIDMVGDACWNLHLHGS